MSKTNKILLALVIILVVVLAGVLYSRTIGQKDSYWAVYLTTGELYFGQLHRFPQLALSDAYLLQSNPGGPQQAWSLVSLKQTVWGPTDKIYLNEKNIAWKAKLGSESQVLKLIQNPQSPLSAAGLENVAPQAAPSSTAATSTP